MKKSLLALAAAGLFFTCGSADAQGTTTTQTPVVSQPVIVSAPVSRTRTVRTQRRAGLVGSVIEFERRKNAWFRRTFLGR